MLQCKCVIQDHVPYVPYFSLIFSHTFTNFYFFLLNVIVYWCDSWLPFSFVCMYVLCVCPTTTNKNNLFTGKPGIFNPMVISGCHQYPCFSTLVTIGNEIPNWLQARNKTKYQDSAKNMSHAIPAMAINRTITLVV